MDREPPTQTIASSEARAQWSNLINRVARRQTRVIVEKSGIPVAAIVSADDLERLQDLDRRRAERFRILDEIGDAFKDVPDQELVGEISRALTEVRAARQHDQVPER